MIIILIEMKHDPVSFKFRLLATCVTGRWGWRLQQGGFEASHRASEDP